MKLIKLIILSAFIFQPVISNAQDICEKFPFQQFIVSRKNNSFEYRFYFVVLNATYNKKISNVKVYYSADYGPVISEEMHASNVSGNYFSSIIHTKLAMPLNYLFEYSVGGASCTTQKFTIIKNEFITRL